MHFLIQAGKVNLKSTYLSCKNVIRIIWSGIHFWLISCHRSLNIPPEKKKLSFFDGFGGGGRWYRKRPVASNGLIKVYNFVSVILVRIQSKCRKIQTRRTPNTDTLHALWIYSFTELMLSLIFLKKDFKVSFFCIKYFNRFYGLLCADFSSLRTFVKDYLCRFKFSLLIFLNLFP